MSSALPLPDSVYVDPTACAAHGLCAAWLPERITLDEWGYPCVDGTPLDPATLRRAEQAAAECPVRAFRVAVAPSRPAMR
ncbi:ferredoxin [Tersicoccus sp. MR15.9]|uniref:ferredoxin n=1 Tax=Tersicoccus mangrovi TaxID=3121635 RepID=UPI002FE598BC